MEKGINMCDRSSINCSIHVLLQLKSTDKEPMILIKINKPRRAKFNTFPILVLLLSVTEPVVIIEAVVAIVVPFPILVLLLSVMEL